MHQANHRLSLPARLAGALCFTLLLLAGDPPTPLSSQAGPCREVTIATIQGDGDASPLANAPARFCTAACVTGVTAEGFFVQSVRDDSSPLTSEGAYVYRYPSWQNPRQLKAGDMVHLSGFTVQEFYGQTEIVKLANDKKASYQVTGSCKLPEPVTIPMMSDPDTDPQGLYERYEGMRVSLSLDASVTGPTQRYISRFPAGDPEVTVVSSSSSYYGRLISSAQLPPDRLTLALSGGLGVDLPDAGALDRLTASHLTGILAFQFDRYTLLVDDPSPLKLTKAPRRATRVVAPEPDQFGVCTYNVENLFDAVDDGDGDAGDWSPPDSRTYAAAVERQAKLIRENLSGCAVIGLQEVEGKDAVWEALAHGVGRQYRYDYWESQDARDITVGILYDASRVEVWRSETIQACSETDYGVGYRAARGDRVIPDPCSAGKFALFDRAPYVADLAVRDAAGTRTVDLRVIVAHLKSKRGEEAENAPRRLLQAQHLASLMTQPLTALLGDLNDTLNSAPLEQLRAGANLYDRHVAPLDRYSYIYQGRTETIDHIILSPGLDQYFVRGGPLHVNADFPETQPPGARGGRVSDHDPLVAQFAFGPTGVTEAFWGAISGLAAPR